MTELAAEVDGSALLKLVYAAILVGICVVIHAAGIAGMFTWLNTQEQVGGHFLSSMWLLVRVAWLIVVLHLMEIVLWAGFYVMMGCLPDLHVAAYFSAVTYSTLGYGDVVLTPEWHLLSGFEALTGILMAGLSTGFFFATLQRKFGLSRKA